MAGDIGDDAAQDGGVEHEHGAGDAGHAAGHHHEQFAARELGEIRPDEQRRFHHAEEDIGRGRQADRAADAERALERQEKPRTIGGRMRQWNSSVVSTLITSTIGSAWKASTNSAPGW